MYSFLLNNIQTQRPTKTLLKDIKAIKFNKNRRNKNSQTHREKNCKTL